MTTSRSIAMLLFAFGVILAAIAVVAWAQQSEDILSIEQPVDRDLYVASDEVNVRSTVNGDLVVAGQFISVDAEVIGDIIVAGQDIEIRSAVSDDVRAAGQHVRIMAPVSGHVVAAGQTVTIEHTVGDWAWLAGNVVEVRGNVGGDVKIRATKITIDAEVVGDVDLIGDQLFLGPGTLVRGDLTWRSDNEADISPDAQIEGELIQEPLPEFAKEFDTGRGYMLPINVIVAAVVLFLLFSRPLRASVDRVAKSPVWSLLLGLAVFCVSPVLAVFLLFTGVGVWLGFTMLFVFLALLLLGVLTGLYAAADITLRKFRPQPALWQSLAAILVTVVAVSLLAKVPWLGFILIVAIWMIGIGGLCWSAWAALLSFRHRKHQQS